jgi:formylmethanofuran dehydrogenase subunit E-like metal-binding protein
MTISKDQKEAQKKKRMLKDAQKAIIECDAKNIANYTVFMELLTESALGKLQGQTAASQLSSIKLLMEKAEKVTQELKDETYLEKTESKTVESVESTDDSVTKNTSVSKDAGISEDNIISLRSL